MKDSARPSNCTGANGRWLAEREEDGVLGTAVAAAIEYENNSTRFFSLSYSFVLVLINTTRVTQIIKLLVGWRMGRMLVRRMNSSESVRSLVSKPRLLSGILIKFKHGNNKKRRNDNGQIFK